mmetsp:Transcript_24215/g.38721  ORF Transcript_24215/g.38721 Transcript_24215/m.38721 type:complete len:117 (+) Transcript_24215:88-438(+)
MWKISPLMRLLYLWVISEAFAIKFSSSAGESIQSFSRDDGNVVTNVAAKSKHVALLSRHSTEENNAMAKHSVAVPLQVSVMDKYYIILTAGILAGGIISSAVCCEWVKHPPESRMM